MKMIKKSVILAIVLLILIYLFFFLTTSVRFAMFVNWGVYLPKNKKNEVVFEDFFRTGDQITILTFDDSNQLKKMIKMNGFAIFKFDNYSYIDEKIEEFYNRLSDEGKNFFSNMQLKNILNVESDNYYLVKEKGGQSFLILILSLREKTMYCLTTIR